MICDLSRRPYCWRRLLIADESFGKFGGAAGVELFYSEANTAKDLVTLTPAVQMRRIAIRFPPTEGNGEKLELRPCQQRPETERV